MLWAGRYSNCPVCAWRHLKTGQSKSESANSSQLCLLNLSIYRISKTLQLSNRLNPSCYITLISRVAHHAAARCINIERQKMINYMHKTCLVLLCRNFRHSKISFFLLLLASLWRVLTGLMFP